MKKNLLFVLMIFVFGISAATYVSAAQPVIDGDYTDWGSRDDMQQTGGSYFTHFDVRYDENNLYIYAKETAKQPWEKYFSYASPQIVDKDGRAYGLIITENSSSGDSSELAVRHQNGYVLIKGAKGIRTKSDTYEFELVIPLEDFGSVDYISVNTGGITEKFYPAKIGDETQKPQEPETEEKPDESVEDITNPGAGIVIDGTFADWDSYPHTLVTNWNMPQEQRTENNCRKLGLTHDSENIYFHVRMIPGWNDRFNGNQYTMTVAGYAIELFIFQKDGATLPDYSLGDGIYDLSVYYKDGTTGTTDFTYIAKAEAKLAVKQGSPDEVEVKIPIAMFERIFGVKFEDIKEVKIENPNLFDHGISSAGSSSGAILGVTISIASVGIGSYVYSRKKAKPPVQ